MRIDEFLLARIAEDEADAEAALTHPAVHLSRPSWIGLAKQTIEWSWHWRVVNWHPRSPDDRRTAAVITGMVETHGAWTPERVLAECAAKRAALVAIDHREGFDDAYELILHPMAAVYADHPDFDPTWRNETATATTSVAQQQTGA